MSGRTQVSCWIEYSHLSHLSCDLSHLLQYIILQCCRWLWEHANWQCFTFPFSERSTFVRCLDQTSSANAGELEAFFCVGSLVSVQRTFQCRLLRRHSSVESKFRVCCTTYACVEVDRSSIHFQTQRWRTGKEATKAESCRKTYIEKGKFCLSRQSLLVPMHCHGLSQSSHARRWQN